MELNGIGIGEGQEQRLHNTIATFPGGTLNVNYAATAGGMYVKPFTREPSCETHVGEFTVPEHAVAVTAADMTVV